MKTFGELLQTYRRDCRDPLRGGQLTQERLGELLGSELGDAGYSGAAVSYWERDKSKIDEDDRLVLTTLILVLHRLGGLRTPDDGNELLRAGNYRDLNSKELSAIFTGDHTGIGGGAEALVAGYIQSPKLPEGTYGQPDQGGLGRSVDGNALSTRVDHRRRQQLILLDKVEHFWVEGVLESSLEDAPLIELKWRSDNEAVELPWADVLPSAAYENLGLSAVSDVGLAFEEAERALLVLGSPGAGKTTLLIRLAQMLIDVARKDPSQPIPVLLNLMSWERRRGRLSDWVTRELTAKYQIPAQLGRSWLEKDQLILLLDGFDEVVERHRLRCAEAINQFRERHGLTGIVVCSRVEGYRAEYYRLRLSAAIMLQSLSPDQIEEYLVSAGPRLSALRSAMVSDSALQEMAKTPLILSVMGAAYSDVDRNDGDQKKPSALIDSALLNLAPGDANEDARRRNLFDIYVQKMFQRKGCDPAYPPALTVTYLSTLAHQLQEHNVSVFLIEQLQPSWLPGRSWRFSYILSHSLVVGIMASIILALFMTLVDFRNPRWAGGLFGSLSEMTNLSTTWVNILLLLGGNLLLAMTTGAICGYYMERYDRLDPDSSRASRLKWQRIAVTGLVVASITIVTLLFISDPVIAIAWGVAEVVVYVIVARYVHGQSFDNDIRSMESIGWSWPNSLEGLLIGIVLGITAEMLSVWLLGGTITGRTTSVFGLAGAILGGMRGRRVEKKNRPNEGIYLSFRNALLAALAGGPVLGALVWFFYGPNRAILTALIMVLTAFSLFGGSTVTKHLILRLQLRIGIITPWRYARFLDHATRLSFLRKVGGGYIFMHSYLQDYFATTLPGWSNQPEGERRREDNNL